MSPVDPPVIVGALESSLDALAEAAAGRPLTLVSDPHVLALHGHRIAPLVKAPPILAPRGEQAKSWATLASIIDALALRGVPRGSPLIALGGGSVGDVTGLAASLYKRGCPVIHVPTTLLAQVDSAVGGKTGIDSAGLKNVAGTFHPPLLVIADPSMLDTLDERQMAAGFAEVVKYALIDDPAFFAWCETHGRALLAGDRDARAHAVRHCLRAKARMVRADPLDQNGVRALLNLGHSFAHAIEAEAGIGRLLHGEAVAIGLVLAFRLSAFLRICPASDAERVAALLTLAGLPTRLDQVGIRGPRLLDWMTHDKKNVRGALVLVLVHGIGRAFVEARADRAALRDFLAIA